MSLSPPREELVRQLARRPGHETVRVHLCRALIADLGASPSDILQEQRIEARSRVDALLGDTVFEIKSDLRRETEDAEAQLSRYLENRERETKRRFVGVATDGLDYLVYELREGDLTRINTFRARPEAPDDLFVWLESVVSVKPDLPADALTVTNELGRDSTAYPRASGVLANAWRELADDPEALLKRQLWTDLLGIVYGKRQDADALWFQHSYLTVVAKAFGFSVLGINPKGPEDLLSGASLSEAEINGAIESDFFDWILKTEIGRTLITQLQQRVKRFRVGEVGLDLLKILYESLTTPNSVTIWENTTRRTGWQRASAMLESTTLCNKGCLIPRAAREAFCSMRSGGSLGRRALRVSHPTKSPARPCST